MKKLTYWMARCKDDSAAYSIRTKTRKEAVDKVAVSSDRFDPPVKVIVRYTDAFDLLTQALGEGGVYEGSWLSRR